MQFYLEAPGIMGGNKDKAKEQAEAIKKYDKFRGYRLLAWFYEKDEQYDQAENIYKAAIAEFPDSSSVRMRLGFFYQRRKKFAEAFDAFEDIIKMNPYHMQAVYQIGRTAVFSGQNLDRAEECFKLYLQHEPDENSPSLAATHWRLGMVYEQMGRKALARKEYEAALKLDPHFKEAKKALKKLK